MKGFLSGVAFLAIYLGGVFAFWSLSLGGGWSLLFGIAWFPVVSKLVAQMGVWLGWTRSKSS